MKTITRTIKVRELIASDGRVVKATLKWSNNPASAEAGRAWYLVIDGKIQYPAKSEGITSDELAKVWAGIFVRSLGYKFK
jgi:hypothetical protein